MSLFFKDPNELIQYKDLTNDEDRAIEVDIMKLRKIKTFLTLLLVLVLTVSAAACSTTTQPTSTSSTVSQSSAINSTNEVSISQNGTFNYDEVCQKIELNGKKVSVPFSVKDLGGGYSIDHKNAFYTTNTDGTVNVSFDINYHGVKVLDGQIHNLPAEYKNKNKNLDNLAINVFTQDKGEAGFLDKHVLTIDGICNGDNISKIVQKFGESEETITNQNLSSFRYYKNNNQKYGVTFFCENDIVFSIMFKYNKHV